MGGNTCHFQNVLQFVKTFAVYFNWASWWSSKIDKGTIIGIPIILTKKLGLRRISWFTKFTQLGLAKAETITPISWLQYVLHYLTCHLSWKQSQYWRREESGVGDKRGIWADRTGKEREGEKNLQLKPWGCGATKNHHAFVRPGFVPLISLWVLRTFLTLLDLQLQNRHDETYLEILFLLFNEIVYVSMEPCTQSWKWKC